MKTIIDAHAHVFHRVDPEHPRLASPLFPSDAHVPVDVLLDAMNPQGIEHAIIYPTSAQDNYVFEAKKLHPSRFSVIPEVTSMEHLQQQREDHNFCGVRVVGTFNEPTPLLQSGEFLAAVAEARLILSVYLGPHDYIAISRAAASFPNICFLVNHCGFAIRPYRIDSYSRPDIKAPSAEEVQGILRLARLSNVHVCISGLYAFSNQLFPYVDVLPTARMVAHAFGANRILWGSDYPFTSTEPGLLGLIESTSSIFSALNDRDKDKILRANAARLFALSSEKPVTEADYYIVGESPDQPRVLKLFADADAYYDSLYPSESNHPIFVEELLANESYFVVARDFSDGDIVGTAALVKLSVSTYELKRMYVTPHARGNDLGRLMFERLTKMLPDPPNATIRLETGYLQPEAISLYRSLGFVEIKAFEPYGPDPNSVFMELSPIQCH